MTSPILVTGGTGRLGGRVVVRLSAGGRDVRVLARHQRDLPAGAAFFAGDLGTGEGLEPALRGVETVIHCATRTKGDADATRTLVAAATRTGSPHILYPSIVGIDRLPAWGYTKEKVAAEEIVESSGLPWTILRVTQFYDYCFVNCRRLARFPIVAPVPAGFRVQPIDPDDVAARLVELATERSSGRVTEMAGPHETSWVDLFRSYLAATHRRRMVIPVQLPGTKAVRDGALLPAGEPTFGTRTWEQFLVDRLALGSQP